MMAPSLALDGDGPRARDRLRRRHAAPHGARHASPPAILDEGLEPQAAVDRPRVHRAGDVVNAEPGVDEAALAELERARARPCGAGRAPPLLRRRQPRRARPARPPTRGGAARPRASVRRVRPAARRARSPRRRARSGRSAPARSRTRARRAAAARARRRAACRTGRRRSRAGTPRSAARRRRSAGSSRSRSPRGDRRRSPA